jgi:solute carrier family 39 (zinc transporter), member 1/2/3
MNFSTDITNIDHFKWLAATCILISALIAGWLPFRQSDHGTHARFPLSKAFSAGIFLGAGLLHMLHEAIIEFSQLGFHYPLAPLLAGGTFLVLLWLEHIGRELEHHHNYSDPPVAILATFMLCFHALFEGSALGVSPELATSMVLFTAIMAHKWAASFALASHLATSDLSHRNQYILFVIFCITTPAAIIITTASLETTALPWLTPTFNALAAGTFLYIGTLHGLRKAVMIERCCDLRQFLFVILGFTTMSILAYWV